MLPPHWATVSGVSALRTSHEITHARTSPKLTYELVAQGTKFSAATRLPATVIAHKRDGHYAVDSDKSADLTSRPEFNVLAQYVCHSSASHLL